MPRECRIQDPGYKPGQPPNHALHAGIGKTNPAPSLITRAAPGGVDVRSQHLRLMQDDPKTLPEDLAGRSSAVAFDTGRPTPHDGVSARLRDIAHEIDLNTTLQGSIRGIIDRLVMDVQSINVRMGLQRQPERPDIGTVGSAGERNDFTYRMALTLLMKIIEGVNHRIDLSPSED
jgi:hypothetical protein